MVTEPPPMAAVKVVPSKLAFAKVNATDPVGLTAAPPSPNSPNTAGLTDDTSNVPRKDPAPAGTVLSKAPESFILPATSIILVASSTSTLFAPPAVKNATTTGGVAVMVPGPVLPLT